MDIQPHSITLSLEEQLFKTFPISPLGNVLTVIVPTRNEAGNVALLLERLNNALAGLAVEVLFVDDSSDDTPQVVQSFQNSYDCLEVNLIHRPEGQRQGGLSGAVITGMRAATADWVCVMDGDLQHPPEVLVDMLKKADQTHAQLVVASRRAEGSEVRELGFFRNLISLGLDGVARVLFSRALKGVSDPLTGFFLVRRDALDLDKFHPKGFKILMEILVRHPEIKRDEVSFTFGQRYAGKSKASAKEVFNYVNLLASLRFGEGWLRMFKFGLVGLSGIVINTVFMAAATALMGIHYLLSAAIATLASSTWNFLWTEFWIFHAGQQPRGRTIRFFQFFLINNLALLLRAPIIYGGTDILGLHYLVSNFLSLVILFIARYFLSASWIWKQVSTEDSSEPINSTSNNIRRNDMTKEFNYNVHGIMTIVSDVGLPELESFLVEEPISTPTMRVRIGRPQRELRQELKAADPTIRHHYYRELFGRFGFESEINIGEKIEVVASPVLRYSPHVLYTNLVEPILRWSLVERGYVLVHGATIAYRDKAYMITARTDTGKTTTLLKILNQQRRETDKAAFLSDDMTILSPDGKVMAYPKPLTISHHTVNAVNPEVLTTKERFALIFQSRIHSRSTRKVALWMRRTKLPMATINTIVQWLVPPPKYTVDRLVPTVKFTDPVDLAGLFIIERGKKAEYKLENPEAMEVLLSNCEDAYGFPPYESIKEFLYLVNETDLREVEKSIIRSAFSDMPATLVRNENLAWWIRIPGYVDEEMAQYFDETHSQGMSFRMEKIPSPQTTPATEY